MREKLGDEGVQVVEGLMAIAFGDAKARRAFFGEPVTASTRDRLAAMQELADRGWGRPQQMLDVGADENGGPVVVRFIGLD